MTTLRIELSKGTFTPNSTVSGRILVQNEKEQKSKYLKVTIHGGAHTKWHEQESNIRINGEGKSERYTVTKTYSSRIEYVKQTRFIWNLRDPKVLPPGLSTFPFSFKLPSNCPPSYEGAHGHIRYRLEVEFQRPWKFDVDLEQVFKVTPPKDLNQVPLGLNPMLSSTSRDTGMIFTNGIIKITVNVSKRAFTPCETIPISVLVENSSSKKVNQIEARLSQNSVFLGERRSMLHECTQRKQHSTKVAFVEKSVNVLPNSTEELLLNLRVPAKSTQTFDSQLIRVAYCLHVEVRSTSTFRNTVCCELPIVIGTISTSPPSQPSAPLQRELSSPPAYSSLPPPSYEEAVEVTKI